MKYLVVYALPARWDFSLNFLSPADEETQELVLTVMSSTLNFAYIEATTSKHRPQRCALIGQYAEVETNCKNSGQSLFKILDECEIFIKRGRKTEWQERLKPAWEKYKVNV